MFQLVQDKAVIRALSSQRKCHCVVVICWLIGKLIAANKQTRMLPTSCISRLSKSSDRKSAAGGRMRGDASVRRADAQQTVGLGAVKLKAAFGLAHEQR